MKFDLPKDQSSIIKVIGVGGGGSNAVNHMFKAGIKGVDFMVCNTDHQALDISPVPHKVQLGASLTEGRGAGSLPEVGRNAAIENIDEMKAVLEKNTKMVFVTAGMGGGTGTGAAPVIAQAAKELGILTVGIVTMPFFFEGRKRRQQADLGIEAIRESVDTLLVINNDKLREMYGNLSLADAFAQADDVLSTAAKGIAEIITRTGYINVDFEDVRTVMVESGVAIMGSASAEGENRAMKAVEKALASPLLNDNDIEGARYVLLNITFGGQEVLMDEISDITDYIQEEAGSTADVIWGYGQDESLGDEICVTLIATGFNTHPSTGAEFGKKPERKVRSLNDEVSTTLTNPIEEKEEKKVVELPKEEPSLEPYILKKETIEPEKKEEVKPETQEPVQVQGAMNFDLPQASGFEETKEEPVEETPVEPVAEVTPVAEATPFEESTPVVETPVAETPDAGPHSFEAEEESLEPYLKSTGATSMQSEEPSVEPIVSRSEPAPERTAPMDEPEPVRNPEEQQKRANERIMKLKGLSLKLRTPSGLSEMENEPAYKRRQVRLDDTPHSSESQVSRYTLSEEEDEDGDKSTGIRPNNSFLHDNVD